MPATDHTADLDAILSPRARDSLKHLELFARRTAEGLLHGTHRSKRKGVSTEFDHHKAYQPGDALKHVDWKVSARHDEYVVKRYIEDTSLSVRLVLDRSASMLSNSGGATKYLQAARLCACLAYLIIRQRDSVGLALAATAGTTWLPARSAETHLVRILRALADTEPAQQDALTVCLRALRDRADRKGLTVVVTDLMFDPLPVQKALGELLAQGHEMLLCHVRDPAEEDFPFNRWCLFRDLENHATRHRLDTVPLKKIYIEEYARLVDEWRTWTRKYDAHFVSFRTDEHVETVLSEYIAYREEIAGKHG